MAVRLYKSKSEYQNTIPFEARASKIKEAMDVYNGERIPLWIDFMGCESLKGTLKKHKYLVQSDLALSNFMAHLRKSAELPKENAIFALINNSCPTMSSTVGFLYQAHKEEDGMLYITLKEESVFGYI